MLKDNTDGIWDCKNSDNAVVLPIRMLEPYTKILNESHYLTVIESIKLEGLINPLVILQIDEDDWHNEYLSGDGTTLNCSPFGQQLRYRVQCGNHRFYALRDYFKAEAIPCEVYDNPEDAYKACNRYRRSKVWKALKPTYLL